MSAPPSPPDLAAAMDEVRRAHRHLIVASDRLMAMLRVVVQKPSPPASGSVSNLKALPAPDADRSQARP